MTRRRDFLRQGLLLTGTGLAGGWLLGRTSSPGLRADEPASPGHEQRLKELGLELPPPPKSIAIYVPAVITGNTLYTAGHIVFGADGKPVPGKVGADLSVEEGAAIARRVGLSLLSTVRHTLGGLDRVVRLVKVLGMVNCTPDFAQQPQVINGFSQLMIDVFGEQAGRGARSAVGVAALPGNTPVEVEAVFEIRTR
jgi:enamine deaminase RidA (YjgF/YER057c/UK114 family)